MAFTLSFIEIFFVLISLVMPLLVFLSLVIIGLGQVVCHIEKWQRFDGLYWSLITATTVGYGDIRPLKKMSRVLSVLIALIGLMYTGIIIAMTLQAVELSIKKNIDPQMIEKMKNIY